jgi:hypothetical protein
VVESPKSASEAKRKPRRENANRLLSADVNPESVLLIVTVFDHLAGDSTGPSIENKHGIAVPASAH